MFNTVQEFQNQIKNHHINIFGKSINEELTEFQYFFISDKDYDINIIVQRQKKSNIIIFKQILNDYIILCYDSTIILFEKSGFSLINTFFDKYKESTIIILTINDNNLISNCNKKGNTNEIC